ncbi:hypothetical protein [Tumebacillus flagellatus]|nr:hypothetical protein [Tumebacillus flagellatus]
MNRFVFVLAFLVVIVAAVFTFYNPSESLPGTTVEKQNADA